MQNARPLKIKRVLLGSFLLSTACLSAQFIAPEKSQANYILRQNNFVEQRQNSTQLNFAALYYRAYQALQQRPPAQKRGSDEWTPLGPFGSEPLAGTGRVNSMQIHPNDSNTWFICVAQGGLWKTSNAGSSWQSISGDLPVLRTSSLAIDPVNPDIMYVATGDFAYLGHNLQANESKRNTHYGLGIYKTRDGGQHWEATGLSFKQLDFEGSLIAKIIINPANTAQLIAVGQTGAYLSQDSAKTWTKTSSKLFWDLEQDPVSPQVLYASSGYVHSYRIGEASLLKSTDFGANWTTLPTNIPSTGQVQRIQLAISPSDNNTIYAIACDTLGGFYGFYRSVNAGASFTQTLDKNYQYNILNSGFSKALGGQGRYDLAICVDRYDKNHVIIGGINAWHTKNGGNSFSPLTLWSLNYYGLSLHADIHEIKQHPSNNSFFACHDGGLSRSFQLIDEDPDSLQRGRVKTAWVNYREGLSITSFYRLSINAENGKEMIAGAQDNSTVYTDGNGFVNLSGGDGMESVFMDAVGYRYTSSQNGRVNVYWNIGNNYTYTGSINPPNQELGEWTTPFVSAAGRLYVLYGNLYAYDGDLQVGQYSNFPNMNGLNYPHLGSALAVDKNDAKRMYVCKRGFNSLGISNELWSSANGGQNWEDISGNLPRDLYPSYVHMSMREPEKVWLCFSGFDSLNKVFYSSNAGQDWVNITYDLPNIPVNCIVHQNDGSDLVYIGTDLGVFYLEKNSKTWVYFSKALPPLIISELEIDEKRKTLVAASFGRGLWEVGLHNFIDPSTGISSEARVLVESDIYPNPSNQVLKVSITHNGREVNRIRLIDITGKEVVLEEVLESADSYVKRFNIQHLLAGAYFVIIETGYSRSVHRFVKE